MPEEEKQEQEDKIIYIRPQERARGQKKLFSKIFNFFSKITLDNLPDKISAFGFS